MSDDPRKLCGPAELIEKLLDGRASARQEHQDIFGNVTDSGVRHLVTLCYFASQTAEEGRYPRFRLYVPPAEDVYPAGEDPWQLARFGHPIVLQEVDDLRRLAPCATSHDFALEVHEQASADGDSEGACVGIRLAHSGEGGTEIFSTSLWARHVRPGLMIRIDGPGELRVSEAQRAWDLRAGKLIDLGGLPTHPLPLWLDRLSKKLATKERFEKYISHTLFFAWNELLHLSSEQRRGGCFVVLPRAPLNAKEVAADYQVGIKYQTEGLGLGTAVADFVESCRSNVTISDPDQFKRTANQWLRDRYSLLSLVESMARLSGVDGCTVLDDDLRLVGFGGKIGVMDASDKKQLRDARANKFLSKDIMKRTGTRHLSAYRLCQAVDGVSCYVVSQDGHVTAFWSNREIVHRWSPYWSWAKRSDQF